MECHLLISQAKGYYIYLLVARESAYWSILCATVFVGLVAESL